MIRFQTRVSASLTDMCFNLRPARYRAGWAAMPTGLPVPDHRPSLDKGGEEVRGVKEGKSLHIGACLLISVDLGYIS